MTLEADIRALTTKYSGVGYYAGSGDRDNDGDPDRADLDDGNGVDCSGWIWLLHNMLRARGHYRIHLPLTSTAGFARWARDMGYTRPMAVLLPGDLLIHDRYDDPYNSGGPRGHAGMVVTAGQDGTVTTSESASSENGVGFYRRRRSWWCLNIRVPTVGAPAPLPEVDLTPQESQMLRDVHTFLSASKDPATNMPLDVTLYKNVFQGVGASIFTDEFRRAFKSILDRLTAIESRLP